MTSLVGKTLHNGKYTLEQELGRGGFGITYKAINHALGQVVVIKTLNEVLRQDPNFADSQRRFQDEARRLAKCFHPNIVRVSDFFTENGLPYIVMDYIPGKTLDMIVLPNQPLPEAIALHYIGQVAEALKAIHQSGLLHRDVKPQNLILREGSQQIILIDFGIAREFTPGITQTHTSLISSGYAPIEQYLPHEKRTPATDVYGLAATFYTLLTAQVPVAAVLRDRVPLPSPRDLRPDLSAMVSQAVMRGMAVEPQYRPAHIDEWLALLPNAAGNPAAPAIGSTSHAATVAVMPQHRRPVVHTQPPNTAAPAPRSNRYWWLAIILPLAAIVPFALGYVLSRSPNPTTPPNPEQSASPTPVESPTQPIDSNQTPELEPDEPEEPIASPEATEEEPEPEATATPTPETSPTPDEPEVTDPPPAETPAATSPGDEPAPPAPTQSNPEPLPPAAEPAPPPDPSGAIDPAAGQEPKANESSTTPGG